MVKAACAGAMTALALVLAAPAPLAAAEADARQVPLQIGDDYKNQILQILAELPDVQASISLASSTQEESAARGVYYTRFGETGFYKIVVGAGLEDLVSAGWTVLPALGPQAGLSGLSSDEIEVAHRASDDGFEMYARYLKGSVMLVVQNGYPQGAMRDAEIDVLNRLETLVGLADGHGLFFTCKGVLVEPYDWAIGATVADDLAGEARALAFDIERWQTSRVDLDATPLAEIEAEIEVATRIAEANGINRELLQLIHEQTRKAITEAAFWTDRDAPPPTLDPMPSTRGLFGTRDPGGEAGHLQSVALKAWETRQEAHKLRILKRATVAYLEALLSSREILPACCISAERSRTMVIKGVEVPQLNCPDPLVDDLRRYRNAVVAMASTGVEREAHAFELLMQEQQLMADVMAVIPLVGDAIDLFALYANEDLTGHCLTPFEKGLTALLVALPVAIDVGRLGREAKRQLLAFARNPRAMRELSGLTWALDFVVNARPELGEALAKRWGAKLVEVVELEKLLKEIPADVARLPIADVDAALGQTFRDPDELAAIAGLSDAGKRAKLIARWEQDAVIGRTLRDAADDRIWINQLPKELQERAISRSDAIMRRNLATLQGEFSEIAQRSNIVRSHFEGFRELADNRNEIFVFRSVNPDATEAIARNFATKGMNVKGKSADWGAHAAFIPVDQNLSKLGNPEAMARLQASDPAKYQEQLDEIVKFHKKVADCIDNGECREVALELPEGKVKVIPADPAAGRSHPRSLVEGADGRFYERRVDTRSGRTVTYEAVDMAAAEAEAAKDLMVLADPETGLPLTADYDFLAISIKDRHRSPSFHPERGFTEPKQWESIDAVNEVAKNKDYTGGRVAHHGPEVFFPASPGAMEVDPYVTVIGPRDTPFTREGVAHVPRCDEDCMRLWCEATNLCGGLEICLGDPPRNAPCIPVDPNRLLKDFFHSARLRGWNLTPNSRWGWGDYNVIGGWTVQRFLAEEQRRGGLNAHIARRMLTVGLERAGEYLFQCQGLDETAAN